MPTNHDETLHERYAREHQAHLAIYARMTPEQISDMATELHNALARLAALSHQAEPTDTYTAVDMATAAAQGFRDGQAAAEQAAAQDERPRNGHLDGWLAYTDPEVSAEENTVRRVSAFVAGRAFNDICRMLGGRWPDAKLEQEAPAAYKFFMALIGAAPIAQTAQGDDQ